VKNFFKILNDFENKQKLKVVDGIIKLVKHTIKSKTKQISSYEKAKQKTTNIFIDIGSKFFLFLIRIGFQLCCVCIYVTSSQTDKSDSLSSRTKIGLALVCLFT
jgi:hypothetical protein